MILVLILVALKQILPHPLIQVLFLFKMQNFVQFQFNNYIYSYNYVNCCWNWFSFFQFGKASPEYMDYHYHIYCTFFILDPMLRDYWTYQGSLTSPPCSENVTWVIFRYPLTISNTQVCITLFLYLFFFLHGFNLNTGTSIINIKCL